MRIGSSFSFGSPPVSAARHRSAAVDSVELSGHHAPIDELMALKKRLQRSRGEAFSRIADELVEVVETRGDPVAARAAVVLLLDEVKFPDPVGEWIAHRGGPARGPAAALRRIGGSIGFPFSRGALKAESFQPFLEALADLPPSELLPDEAIRSVAMLARALEKRAGLERKPDEPREDPELDRQWARGVGEVVDRWWQEGRLEVCRDGQPLPYGAVPLRELACQEALSIQDGCVRLRSGTPRASADLMEKARSLAEGIGTWKDDPSPGLDELEKLVGSDLEKARALVPALLDELNVPHFSDRTENQGLISRHKTDEDRVAALLERAQKVPALKELLRPFGQEIVRTTSEAASRGVPSTDNLDCSAKIKIYTHLFRLFPELASARTIASELFPLRDSSVLNNRDELYGLLEELWGRDPALVKPTLDALIQAETAPPMVEFSPDHTKLFLNAYEKFGWRPDRDQVRWLLSFFYLPEGRTGRNLLDWFSDDDMTALARLAGRMDQDGLLADCTLPGPGGPEKPWKQAVEENLFGSEPQSIPRTYDARVEPLFQILCQDPGVADDLLSRVEGAPLDPMEWPAQVALSVLRADRLDRARAARFCKLLEGPLSRPLRGDAAEVLTQHRKSYVTERTRQLETSPAEPAAILDEARGVWRAIARADFGSELATGMLTALDKRFANLPSEQAGPLAQPLLDDALTYLRLPGGLKEMPEEALISLTLCASLAPRHRDTAIGLKAALLGDNDVHTTDSIRSTVLRRLRSQAFDEEMAGLAGSPSDRDRSARLARLEGYIRKGIDLPKEQAEKLVTDAWAQGGLAGLSGFFEKTRDPEETFTRLREVASAHPELAAPWARFEKTLASAGPGKYQEAARLTAWMEEQIAAGKPAQDVEKRALEALALGDDPAALSFADSLQGRILRDPDRVRIGSVSLPIRPPSA
ncbi:MAG: hypothetical protein HY319_07860 [Armatimonadetes bacterium]|nr:hypothetical protein [Armatimonadota bacterium]